MMLDQTMKRRLAVLAIALSAVIVYANSLGNGFVWDDTNVIVTNPLLQGAPARLFANIDATRDYERLPYYRPLTLLTFFFEGKLHGFAPFWMHLVNVLLHAVNAVLVFLLVRSLAGDVPAAFIAALLFAVHPINVEAVDFLSGGRNTLLACFFSLLAVLAYRRAVGGKGLLAAFTAGLLLFAGLLSKENALMVLPFLLWMEIDRFRSRSDRRWSSSAVRCAPIAAAVLVYLVARWLVLAPIGVQAGLVPGWGGMTFSALYKIPPLWDRAVDNLYMLPRYFLTIGTPTMSSLRYDVPDSLASHAYPLLAAWLCIAGALVWLLGKGRSTLTVFGIAWFASFYFPVSGIVPFPSAPMADRYLYLPAIGLWIIAADQIGRVFVAFPRAARPVLVSAALLFVGLAGTTVSSNVHWHNDIALFGHFAERYPGDPYGNFGLGSAYYDARDQDPRFLDLAEESLRRSIDKQPLIPGLYTKMGNVRLTKEDNDGAMHYYSLALSVYPYDKEALLNRGITLENLGRGEEARRDFLLFLSLPGHEFSDARPYAESRVSALEHLRGKAR